MSSVHCTYRFHYVIFFGLILAPICLAVSLILHSSLQAPHKKLEGASNGWKRYVNIRYHYSIAYPPTWHIAKPTAPTDASTVPFNQLTSVIFVAESCQSCRGASLLQINALRWGGNPISSRQYIQGYILPEYTKYELAQPTIRPAGLRNIDASLIDGIGHVAGCSMPTLYVVRRNLIISMNSMCDPEEPDRGKAIFSSIFSSFTFVP